MSPVLQALHARWLSGACSSVSLSMARWLHGMAQEGAEVRALVAALTWGRLAAGDSAVVLADWPGRPLPAENVDAEDHAELDDLVLPSVQEMEASLRAVPGLVSDGRGAVSLLVMEDGVLGTWRMASAERAIAAAAAQASSARWKLPSPDAARLRELFSADPAPLPHAWQRVAVAMVLRNRARGCRLSVITGGPGTGKTTTVARLLAALLHGEPGLRIKLAAPTGKAADRVAAAIEGAGKHLPPELALCLPREASTLHALLGANPATGAVFRHADNPLDCDLLVIDEVSMADPPLLHATLEAMPTGGHVVLVGDPHQLPSVGAGWVLADLVESSGAADHALDAATASDLAALRLPLPVAGRAPPTRGLVAGLVFNHRAAGVPELVKLADAVRRGDEPSLPVPSDVVARVDPDPRVLVERAVARGRALASLATLDDALRALNQEQVVCATRHGPLGAVTLSRQADDALAGSTRGQRSGAFYKGRVVLVTGNDADRGLRNGDVGLCWPVNGVLRVAFGSPAKPRLLDAADLPPHDPAWAITIHKSQGSEYAHVDVVLPTDENHPLLLRELLYTAVTRASRAVTLHATPAAMAAACARPTSRRSRWLAAEMARLVGGGPPA